ncbi:MAG: 23S rRNA pseudouridine2605 synthase [Acidimicrobiales bacterium]|jgi:23S rRNA pseudouridine2605 synthase
MSGVFPLGEGSEHPDGERLQKVMARVGVGSRRVSENLIEAGRVLVNGEAAVLGARVHIEADVIEVDGAVISMMPDAVTYLLNKPGGVVTTASDPQGRPIVVDLVPDDPRVFPVGRLDLDTEGLLLLTNDGGLAHRLTHPSFGIEKEYLVHLEGTPSRAVLRQLRDGVELDDGTTAPAKASTVAPGMIKLTIHEGRNRQIRRMCEAVGHPVRRLARTRIGPLRDGRLKPGEYRVLEQAEVLELQRAVALR